MKTSNYLKKIALLIIPMAALALSGHAIAKGHGKGQQQSMIQKEVRMMMSKLDLNEQQKEQMKAIKENSKAQMKALKEAHQQGTERDELQALIMADTFDEGAFLALQQRIAAKKQQGALIQARTMNQIFNVLTPEQKQQFLEIKAERKEKRKEKRQDRRNQNS